jgi:hypothetical protein
MVVRLLMIAALFSCACFAKNNNMQAPPASKLTVGCKLPDDFPSHLPTLDGALVPLVDMASGDDDDGNNNNNNKLITVLCFLRHLA